MPKTDGIAATKGILALDADARVVIVSSVGTQNKLREAIEAGAKDFIQKPFSGEQIEKLLEFYSKEA
jgi:two-component system chemotaxis response regulator CheY